MAISNAFCTVFKVDLFKGTHTILASGGNSFKMALYTSSATLGATTTAYSATNEVSGTGYTATGNALTIAADPTSSGTTSYCDFDNETWGTSTITARGCLIYNDTAAGDPACSSHDFSEDKSSSGGDFTVQFPTADSSNAIWRIA